MADEKLLPCPFCGSEITTIETRPGRGEIYCGNCDVVMGGNEAMTPDELTEKWNTRTLTSGECEIECFDDGVDEGMDGEWFSYAPPTWYLSCGHEIQGEKENIPNYCPGCGRRVVER